MKPKKQAKGMEVDVAKVSMGSATVPCRNEGGDSICKLLAEKIRQAHRASHDRQLFIRDYLHAAAAVEMEMKVRDIKEIVFPHPTVSEIIRKAYSNCKQAFLARTRMLRVAKLRVLSWCLGSA